MIEEIFFRTYLLLILSMIADEMKRVVFDVRKPIGMLDKSFVISWISSGAVFSARS